MSKKKENNVHSINGWWMLRDVFISSINKGQFPLACATLIILSIIWKMPPEDVAKLAAEIINKIQTRFLFGYFISVVIFCSWILHIKLQRKMYEDEISRISDERNELQKKQLGVTLESSTNG